MLGGASKKTFGMQRLDACTPLLLASEVKFMDSSYFLVFVLTEMPRRQESDTGQHAGFKLSNASRTFQSPIRPHFTCISYMKFCGLGLVMTLEKKTKTYVTHVSVMSY